jgi:hypothetical protein
VSLWTRVGGEALCHISGVRSMKPSEERHWRIRKKYAATEDLSPQAWEGNEVGIWYGASTTQDFGDALKEPNPRDSLHR